MTIRIAEFRDAYAQGVIDVILPIQQSEFAIPITLEAQPDLRDIPGFYKRGQGNFWVALSGDAVVGTVGLLDIGNQEAALRKMFVKADFRGSEYRAAKKLLDTAVGWCVLQRVRRIYLGTTAKFLAAHRFYEKNGFSLVSKEQLPASFPIMAVDTRFYSLDVAG